MTSMLITSLSSGKAKTAPRIHCRGATILTVDIVGQRDDRKESPVNIYIYILQVTLREAILMSHINKID